MQIKKENNLPPDFSAKPVSDTRPVFTDPAFLIG